MWNKLGSAIPSAAPGDETGWSLQMNANGDRVVISSPLNDDAGADAGQVRVFEYSGTAWNQMGPDLNGQAAGDWFGNDVCMSADGLVIAIGAINHDETANGDEGTVQVFAWSGTAWVQRGSDLN